MFLILSFVFKGSIPLSTTKKKRLLMSLFFLLYQSHSILYIF